MASVSNNGTNPFYATSIIHALVQVAANARYTSTLLNVLFRRAMSPRVLCTCTHARLSHSNYGQMMMIQFSYRYVNLNAASVRENFIRSVRSYRRPNFPYTIVRLLPVHMCLRIYIYLIVQNTQTDETYTDAPLAAVAYKQTRVYTLGLISHSLAPPTVFFADVHCCVQYVCAHAHVDTHI